MQKAKYRLLDCLVVEFAVRFGLAREQPRYAGVLKESHIPAVGMTINSQKATGHTAGETVAIGQNDHRSVAICQSAVIQAAKQIAEFRQVTDIMP